MISVGRYAVQYCDSLKSVFIPQKVASLGGYAFRGCSALDTFSIPQSVKSIGENAFWDTAFYNDPANWRNGALYLDGCLLKAKNSAKGEFTLEEGTRLIADKAAYGCEAISSLSISEETLYIGQEAFSGCDGLMSIQIFGGVVKFGRSVFYGCSNLEQIVIPDSVTWIGDQIFYGCDKIKTATMPISVIPLITKANLEKVVLTSGKEIGASAFSGAKNLTSVTLPDSVAKIGRSAFSDCSSLTEIAFPQGVTEIGESAFAGCRTLEEIVLPEGIEEIRSNTFASCVSLRSIMVPDRVTKIGSSAFNGCVRITQAKIGSGVKEIGSDAFENCYRLVEVWNRSGLTLQKGEEKNGKVCLYAKAVYLADESSRQTVTAEETLFYEDEEGAVLLDYYGNAAELSLPDHSPDGKDYAVYQKAFYGRDDLKNVTLGEGVTEIGKEAFYNCSNLLNVEFGNRLTVIGEGAFHNCNRLLHVEIPDSVTEIGKEAFYNCLNLTSVTLGSGTAKVGGSAFGNCYKLIEVYNRSALSVTRGESGNGRVAEYARNVYQAEGESRQIVKDGFLFYETEEECLLLAYIGEEEEIMLPQKSPGGKEYAIYQYAFAESNLHRVFLPKEMVEIGEKCFMNCNKLQAICYAGDVSEWKKVKGSSNISADLLYYYSETAPTQEQWKESGRWWHYTEENKAEEWEKPKV